MTGLNFVCPACGTLSTMVIGATQAVCTNADSNADGSDACAVIMFNPSLPDGGMSDPQFVTVVGWENR